MTPWVWLALALFAACKYPEPGDVPEDGPPTATYVVAHTNAAGDETKLVIAPLSGELELSGGRTFGGTVLAFTAGGYIYVAADRVVRRFSVVEGQLVEDGPPISFITPATDVQTFDGFFTVFDATLAWYFDDDLLQVYALELDTMTVSTAIHFGSLDADPDGDVTVTGAAAVGDMIYMPYHFLRPSYPLHIESELYIARFSRQQKSLLTPNHPDAMLSNRCSRSHVFARRDSDALIILGDAGAMKDLAPPPTHDNCLLEILPDAPTVFSPFHLDLDILTMPRRTPGNPVQLSADRVITWARGPETFTSQADWDANSRWTPQLTTMGTQPGDWSTEQLTGDVVSVGRPGQTFVVDDKPYFAVPTASGGVLYEERGGAWVEALSFSGTITLIVPVD